MPLTHIIGAGLSGLSAALMLAKAGKPVRLYEASPQAGGRCRSYHDLILEREIDNGNHILIQANKAALGLIKEIGAEKHWLAVKDGYPFIDLATHKRWKLKAPLWIPPLPLIAYGPLLKLPFASSSSTLGDVCATQHPLWQKWLAPLAKSALNTPPSIASTALFSRILWRMIKAGPRGAMPILPQAPLQHALINPLLDRLGQKSASLLYRKRLRALDIQDNTVTRLLFHDGSIALNEGDQVIIATSATVAGKLLPAELTVPDQFETIMNIHYRLPKAMPSLPRMLGIVGGLSDWLFVRDGILSTTTSAANFYQNYSQDMMAYRIWTEIQQAMGITFAMPPYRMVVEKRATFRATPEQEALRPDAETPYHNLTLAGDYTLTGLPATIEGSILSGQYAAELSIAKAH